MKQRAHAATIIEWANGAQIQYRQDAGMKWTDCDDPAFVADYEYRVKPAEPERVYPRLDIDPYELVALYEKVLNSRGIMGGRHQAVLAVATAGVRAACDSGQVVTREEFDRAVGDRKAFGYAVGKAVRGLCHDIAHGHHMRSGVLEDIMRIDLDGLIAEVRQVKP